MIRTLDFYLGRIILQYTLITSGVLLCLYTFINFLDQIETIGQGNFGLFEAILYVIFMLPSTLYELFPMSTLLGAIIGLSIMAKNNELTTMRTSGSSMLQITLSALKVGTLFVIFCLIIGEFVAPLSRNYAEHKRVHAINTEIEQSADQGIWIRDQNTYTLIQEILPDLTLLDVHSFIFDSGGTLLNMVETKQGHFDENSWILEESRITTLNGNGDVTISLVPHTRWMTAITPEILSTFLVQPDQLSFGQLRRYITHLENNQQNSDRFALALWTKIMLPLAIAAMVALAVPFVFINLRSSNLGRNLFFGIMVGIAFYVANRGLSYAVLAAGISPALGASLPVLTLLLLIALLMSRI
ncbi:MAG: LPS export ABC transporter permease LptG [Gammaproteobacteria bacterium]|nr:LPS export ABC transporter permease LptG [Gammaproteobacteria bacterium]MCY4219729.1 LPS export ABC transporter permease LptG [Gammaproteobacteria bacterium]MCY4276191.1 LPS export ABC transporter permease LptG [Gammaproteobacteria bacterium]